MQKGYIFQRHGAWYLRYRKDETENGKIVRKQLCERLADFNDKYRTKQSVRQKAEDFLDRLDEGRDEQRTLQQFTELSYLPHTKLHKRPSTYKGYRNLYNLHVAPNIAGIRIASFRTMDGQKLLNRLSNATLSHLTLIHVKSFLSGVFSFARRMGLVDSNPMQGTEVPKGKPSQPTHAYSNDEIDTMLKTLKGTPRTAVIVAAYTGCR